MEYTMGMKLKNISLDMNIIKFDNHKTLLNIKNCNKKGVYSYFYTK